MKLTAGFSRFWPSIGTFACMGIDITFLSLALKTIPVGTTYAVWTGAAIMGTSSIGIIFFNEPYGLLKIICILLILTGVIGLRFLSPH